tara:strand:+ start:1347 stop:2063 length:717 start_codon:yes stop_codon:yes gene_type:complete
MSFEIEDVICIIPARGGSKGLPRKNTLKLGGEPLIARPIQQAIESGVIGTVLMTTDDKEIARIAESYGAIVPFIRPPELAQDLTSTEDTLKHALLEYEREIKKEFEIAVFLTATDIFRKVQWIKDAVLMLKENPKLESVFSGYATHKNYWNQQDDGSWERLKPWMATYTSRQIKKPIIREDTGIACASRAWLWREGRRIGDVVDIIVNDDDFTSIDIHQMRDLMLAEKALEINKNTNN